MFVWFLCEFYVLHFNHRSHVYKIRIENIFLISMLHFAVSFHIVATCKDLIADRTRMTLGTMNIRMMPAIWDSFVTRYAAIERWKCSRELNEQSRVIDIMIATGGWTSITSRTIADALLSFREYLIVTAAKWWLQRITATAD